MPDTPPEETASKPPPKLKQINIVIGDQRFEDWGTHSVKLKEGAEVERVYGKTYRQLGIDIHNGSLQAMQVLVWSLLHRSDPALRLDDVEVTVGDCTVEYEFEDDEEPESVPTGPPTEGEAAPEPSPSDETDTSLTSPTGSESDPGSGTT